jgi:hypothetical protein
VCGAGIVAGAPPLLANVAVPARQRPILVLLYCVTLPPRRTAAPELDELKNDSQLYGPY